MDLKRIGFAALGLTLIVGIWFNSRDSTAEQEIELAQITEQIQTEEPKSPAAEIPSDGTRPPLIEIAGWLQVPEDRTEENLLANGVEEFDGQIRIVHFWAAACHNCHATFPFIKALNDEYADDGLQVIGVHAPEFEFEKDRNYILQQASQYGLSWPIALDDEKRSFRTWREQPRAWPMTYVLDADGNVRFERKGEGAYERLAEVVGALIEEQKLAEDQA